MFRLTINTDNAAFSEDMRVELARILHTIALNVERDALRTDVPVRDVNGNKVGTWSWSVNDD